MKTSSLHPLLAAAVTAVLAAGCTPANDNTAGNASASSVPAVPESSSSANVSAYVDGAYTALGSYTSPAGAEQVEVTLTLDDDVITDAVFEGKATHPTSKKLQGMFAEGYREQVVGKPIDELNLTVVNGSSLAPKGFMDAVAKIKTAAL